MKILLSLFLATAFLISSSSCNNCHKVRCESASEIIHVQLVQNGINAVFGEDAFISRDSIMLITENPFIGYLSFNETLQTLDLDLSPHLSYSLELNGLSNHTFSLISEQAGMTECCTIFEPVSVSINGQIVCNREECGEVIIIEI